MDTPQNSVKSAAGAPRRASGKKASLKSQTAAAGSIKRTSIKNDEKHKKEYDDKKELHQAKVYEQIMFERRILLGCTVAVGVATILWVIAIASPYWFTLDGSPGIYVSKSGRYFTYSHSGIFYTCRYAFSNRSKSEYSMRELFDLLDKAPITTNNTYNATHVTVFYSGGINRTHEYNDTHMNDGEGETGVRTKQALADRFHDVLAGAAHETTVVTLNKQTVTHHKLCWPPKFNKVNKKDAALDEHITKFNSAEVTFAVITILLMAMAFMFSIYTFINPRYMFKRTAGGLHFLSMGATLTVIEVIMGSMEYEKKHLPFIHPPGARSAYGFCYYLAWIVLAVNALSGVLFMLYSRKRKGKKAPTEEMGMADEPVVIGR